MPTTFRPYEPDQMLLMPPAMQDWLAAGHLAHHVSDLVDGLDPGVFSNGEGFSSATRAALADASHYCSLKGHFE